MKETGKEIPMRRMSRLILLTLLASVLIAHSAGAVTYTASLPIEPVHPLSTAICAEKEFDYSMPIILLPILRILHERDGGKSILMTPEDLKPLTTKASMEITDIKDSKAEKYNYKRIRLVAESCGVDSMLLVRNGIVIRIEQNVAGVSTSYRQIWEAKLERINFKEKEYERLSKEALLNLLYRNECPFTSLPCGKYTVIIEARNSNAKDAFCGDVIINKLTDAIYSFSLGKGGWLSHASIKRGGTELKNLKFSLDILEGGILANVAVSDNNEIGSSVKQAYFYRNLGLKAYIVQKDGVFAPVQLWKEDGIEKMTMSIEQIWRNPSVVLGE